MSPSRSHRACGLKIDSNLSNSAFAFFSAEIPKNLPLLLVSGSEDPVGNYGAGVKTAYQSYKKAGILEVQMHLFENDRHEILNEQDHGKVDRFILDWLNQHEG